MSRLLSVIIHYLHVLHFALLPFETDAILVMLGIWMGFLCDAATPYALVCFSAAGPEK